MHQYSNYRGPRRRREKKKGSQKIFEEIIVENFHTMGKEIVKVWEAQRVPNRINTKKNMPRHILIKLSKIKYKEKTLKAARGKKLTYKVIPKRLTTDFSAETWQARRVRQDIFKVKKGKNLLARLL